MSLYLNKVHFLYKANSSTIAGYRWTWWAHLSVICDNDAGIRLSTGSTQQATDKPLVRSMQASSILHLCFYKSLITSVDCFSTNMKMSDHPIPVTMNELLNMAYTQHGWSSSSIIDKASLTLLPSVLVLHLWVLQDIPEIHEHFVHIQAKPTEIVAIIYMSCQWIGQPCKVKNVQAS